MKAEAFFGRSPFFGYIAAVTAAAVCFTFLTFAFALYHIGGFETATNNTLVMKALHLGMMAMLFFITGWVFAFVTALVPFAIGWFLADRFKIRSIVFFIAGGALTAVFLAPLSASIPNLGINVQGDEPSLLQKSLAMCPLFAICGALAGTVCWKVIFRQPSFRPSAPGG